MGGGRKRREGGGGADYHRTQQVKASNDLLLTFVVVDSIQVVECNNKEDHPHNGGHGVGSKVDQ